jgi:excisionase family DNA binding protein
VAPILLSIREAAITLGVCERTVWTLAQERELPHVRIGRRVLFSRSALEAWIARQEAASQ